MKKVIVASKNPVKINAVRLAFEQMFPHSHFEFEGASISSDVSDQPMSDAETLTGAVNRAVNAKSKFPNAAYWVGIEGGIDLVEGQMSAFAWIVIESPTLKGKARTAAFFLPPKVAELVLAGKELGEADDIVFGDSNSKQKGGAIGLLTDNLIDRTQLYVPAVMMALIPIKNAEIYRGNVEHQRD